MAGADIRLQAGDPTIAEHLYLFLSTQKIVGDLLQTFLLSYGWFKEKSLNDL
jgi:hypothetical protein